MAQAVTGEGGGPIHLAGGTLGARRHVCVFFQGVDEAYPVLLPFIPEGLERGEKAYHVVDPLRREEHLRRLAAAGVDVETAESSGQLELKSWEDVYLREGHFDPDRMLALIADVLETGKRQGHALTRLVAQMEWALEGHPLLDGLVEYESRLCAALLLGRGAPPVRKDDGQVLARTAPVDISRMRTIATVGLKAKRDVPIVAQRPDD